VNNFRLVVYQSEVVHRADSSKCVDDLFLANTCISVSVCRVS
jgi:hypothetical protein